MTYIRKREHIDQSIRKPFPGKYGLVDLSRMMTYPRPAGSEPEKQFIEKFIDPVPGMQKDMFGNRFIEIGKKPTTVFASHTDTVHDAWSQPPTERQRRERFIRVDPETYRIRPKAQAKKIKRQLAKGLIKLPYEKPQSARQKVFIKGKWAYKHDRDVLGADDTTGVWLMLNLIHEKKPGLYLFHREEEIGGFGSRFIAKSGVPSLKGKKRVISFDRKGYSDIITHQMGDRTASDKFAKEFALKLGGDFRPSSGGSFTDSASYAKKVPECTNVSIGYKQAHTPAERQNLKFARHLYMKLRDIDFEKLPTKRDPKVIEPSYWNEWTFNRDTDKYERHFVTYPKQTGLTGSTGYAPSIYDDDFDREEKVDRGVRTIVKHEEVRKQIEQEKKYHVPGETIDAWKKRIGPGQKELMTSINKQLEKTHQEKKSKIRSVPFDDSTAYDDFVYEDMRRKKRDGIIE